MDLSIFVSTKLHVPGLQHFSTFLQAIASRRDQGHARYGVPNKDKLYLSRLKKELKAYNKTGNA